MFNAAFTRARYWHLSRARLTHSIHSQDISLRSIPILSSNLRLDLVSTLLTSKFLTQIYYIYAMCAPRDDHLVALAVIIVTGSR
jgi:hypothetical protein